MIVYSLAKQTKKKFTGLRIYSKVRKKFGLDWVQTRFLDFAKILNPEPDLWSGSALPLNFGPDLGPVLKSSGSNFGSEPDCGIPNWT